MLEEVVAVMKCTRADGTYLTIAASCMADWLCVRLGVPSGVCWDAGGDGSWVMLLLQNSDVKHRCGQT